MLMNRRDTKMPEKPRTISGGDSESEINYDLFSTSVNSDGASVMNSSQISNASGDSQYKTNLNRTHNVTGTPSCRFPKLEECAHFHYERVQLGRVSVRLVIDEKAESQISSTSNASQNLETSSQANKNCWYIIRVHAGRSEPFMIKRSFENMKFLDEMLHRCVYDRRISELCSLKDVDTALPEEEIENIVLSYLNRLSCVASDAMTCGPILTWLQIDNKGRRLPVADIDTMRCINTPAVGAAYGVRRYVAQACDEISIEVGDMISVIDMPSPAESIWWRGKKSHLQKNQYEVGFFPQSCVATIGDKVPRHMPLPAPLVGSLAVSPTKPVLRKHGKLIAFFRSFILARPSRRRLKQSGIYKERVFSCDLGEHLLNSGQDIPMVLKCCAEFIEEFGIVDGIYRLSGITSNIQKLRRAFDEERVPDLTHPDIKQDIHAVSSLLKMYFRELPNPLCTYQLYDHFVEAIQTRSESNNDMKLRMIRQTVQKLPPPHYRTLKYLATHLYKISRFSSSTGMTERNIAIVWAPNLLRSPALESGGVAALRGVGVQAVVTEYLISNCESIFDDSNDDFGDHFVDSQPNSLSDTNSIQVDSRDNDLSISMERPKSLSVGGAKLLSLEEARIRKHLEGNDKGIPINITNPTSHIAPGTYIEVGGGPSSLPDKYHTVLPVPRSWNKRKSHSSWKSIFTRAPRQSNSNHDMKAYTPTASTEKEPNDVSRQIEVEKNDISIKESMSGLQDKLLKSGIVDVYDGKSLIVESCARSNSVDSLRTAGHSRSVSHDSYFDLLQSPLRGVVTCPSRELSELGLNFDREEPEMRIFSESESLVSSPKVVKESARRTLRARPEDYNNSGNSVNPSPKKQPRLNPQSPGDVIKKWPNNNQSNQDESLCKRYKLEDQLSDIQFIDCSTPEHSVNVGMNNNTIFTSAQVHRPPQDLDIKETDDIDLIGTRNSYPGPQYSYVKYDSPIKETRFSYPGISAKNTVTIVAATKKCNNGFKNDMNVDEQHKNNSEIYDSFVYPTKPNNTSKFAGRYSYYQQSNNENQGDVQIVPRSCSEDVIRKIDQVHKSKLSIMTPQSPLQSPCYSLLVGSTSSDNSSALNTPVYDMDITNVIVQHNLTVEKTKDKDIKNEENKIKDLNALKRELSLDLNEKNTKITFDCTMKKTSTPNTPNFTSDNTTTTSQSMTPSEFCYQNLNLENSPNVEIVEQSFQSYGSKPKVTTPIKSTINIVYNVRSPVKKEQENNIFASTPSTPTSPHPNVEKCYENVVVTTRSDDESSKKLLETNFDETMVYEQVKFYKNAVCEMNNLVQGERGEERRVEDKEEETSQVVPELELLEKSTVKLKENDGINNNDVENVVDFLLTKSEEESDDVPMSDINEDSLEFDQTDVSLYENVELRKKTASVYENIDLKSSIKSSEDDFSHKSDLDNEMEYKIEIPPKIEIKSKNNVSVKQLATKFETSPVDCAPNFEFNQNNHNKINNNRPPSVQIRNKTKDYQNIGNITRSLDENAFVREFGSAKKLENFSFNKSIHQIPEIDNILNENNPNRRKSLEFTRPKSLNQPKKLPQLISKDVKDGDCCRKSDMKLDLSTKIEETKEARNYNVRITPTTENRISLVQYNYDNEPNNKSKNLNSDDDKSMTSISSLKVLGSCKLDRSRIEKIKEERRHQLSEKYRSESFRGEKDCGKMKSKSKSELREFKDGEENKSFDTMRFRSKSRVELSDSQQYSLDNSLLTSASLTTVAAESSNNVPASKTTFTSSTRIRRISDEKNQNDLPSGTGQQISDASISQVVDNKFELKTRQKFEKKGITEYGVRERESFNGKNVILNRNSQNAQRDRYSPQISIKDVAAIFESRSQNQ